MPRQGESYTDGKTGEEDTWPFLAAHGFIRPTKEDRERICQHFRSLDIKIHKRGFDVYQEQNDSFHLYEVKTTGIKRGAYITDHFNGLGFTLTHKEIDNAKALNGQFSFIFVNLAKSLYRIYELSDFFNKNNANIYQTWSVFITSDLNPNQRII